MSRDVSTPQRCSNIFNECPIDDRDSMWDVAVIAKLTEMTEIYFVWIRDSFWSIALEHAGSRRQSGWKLGSQPARIDSSRSSMHAWVRVRLDLSERRFCKTTQGVGSKLPYGAWEIQLRLVLYHNIFYSSMERPSGVPSYRRYTDWHSCRKQDDSAVGSRMTQ